MKYVRVVFAVKEENLSSFYQGLDEYIEEVGDIDPENHIEGAYVSEPVTDRKEALGADWQDRKPRNICIGMNDCRSM